MAANKVFLKKYVTFLMPIEQLKYERIGYWSRRINEEHRHDYEVLPQKILIDFLKGYYD
jgi:Txe/YoeB family toxin of Txe-Axe toxin-antitoxin module